MRNIFKIAVFTLTLFIFSCSDEQAEEQMYASPDSFQVEVVGKGLDCGDTFLIRFADKDENRVNAYLGRTNAYYPVFYAVGLPDEFKDEGLILNVSIRQCGTDDIPVCTAMGPGYAIVCIQSAESLSLTAQAKHNFPY